MSDLVQIGYITGVKCDIGDCQNDIVYSVGTRPGRSFVLCLSHLNGLGSELATFCGRDFHKKRTGSKRSAAVAS